MKTMKRALSMFLAILMLFSVLPPTATAAFIQTEVVGKAYTLQNDFIKVTVNSKNGRFSIQTVDGQPVRKNDQNTFLSFIGGLFGDGIGDSDTSFTTFRINGTDYIFGNKYNILTPGISSSMGVTKVFTSSEYPEIPEGCQAVVTPWSVEGVEITQLLLLFPETDRANSGNVQIFYQINNKSGAEVKVGARILLDTMVGANDGPEFQIGTISGNTLKVERMLSKDPVNDQNIAAENKNYWTMPGYWVMKDTLDPTNPLATNVIAYGYTDIASYRDLDYMIVSHWNKLANEKFEEFSDYCAIPPEQTEAAAEVSRTQRIAERAAAVAEQKEAEAVLKEEAAVDAQPGTKADLDAQKARADADKVKKAAKEAAEYYEAAKAALALIAGGREQVGSSIIDPNLDFTDDKNDYGSADSAVAFYWRGDTDDAKIAAGGTMQLGTVYGLGEVIDPTSVLAISFPNPVTQVEIDPNDQSRYKDYGVFDINVEVENLVSQNMSHDSIDVTMTLEKGLRFVKRDEQGNILRDSSGAPLTSYGSTQTVTFEKALTPEQAEAGEKNPILPGEKIAATFTIVASGKAWPTTRQYMVTASSPQLESEFESKYGESAGDEVRALYNASRANFVFLPSVGSGVSSYATAVSPEECFTKDPKYITVNLTNIEAYNPGSSVRGQESNPNFNLFFEEIVTGKRYQIDVTDNVQCIPTDDGLTGDMRISYTNGTLVDEDGIVLETDLGCELPMGEYRVAIDYISTDDDENAMLDMVTEQTFLVTENEEARIREPGILAVVKETVDFDDSEMMQKINELVAEIQAAITQLQQIATKLESTDWSAAVYDEVIDLAKEMATPVTQIYDDIEKLADFSNVEAEMRGLAKDYDELAGVDFSGITNFDIASAIKGVNVDVSLSDELKKQLSVDALLLGPLGLDGAADLANGGVEGFYNSFKDYGKDMLSPIMDIYDQVAALGDFSSLNENEIAKLKAAFSELQDVDFSSLKNLNLSSDGNQSLTTGDLKSKLLKIIDTEALLNGPLGTGDVSGAVDDWISRAKEAVNSAKEIGEIAQHAYKGDLSIQEGAKLLIGFYEKYTGVSVNSDLTGGGNNTSQSAKVTAAFMVMYAQMKSIYSTLNSKLDTAKKIYSQAQSLVTTVIKTFSDPMAAIEDIVNMGQDAIFDILKAYLEKINKMIDSVKEIYAIAKKSYEGKIDIKEGAELLIGFCEKYLNVTISADLDAVGGKSANTVSDTYAQGKKMALAFMAMYARMKNLYSGMNTEFQKLIGIYNQMKESVDAVLKLFTAPGDGAFALMDLVKEQIMDKLDGLGIYKDMFMQALDVIEDFDSIDPGKLMGEAMNFAVTTARVKADQALYSEIYGLLITAATQLDPNVNYEWNPGDMKPSLPTYQLMSFENEAELKAYQDKVAERNQKKKNAAKDEATKASVGNDGVLVKITGMIRQFGDGTNVTDYIVDTSTEPAIINDTVAFTGGDLVFTQGKLKISFGNIATIDAGEYISKAQKIYGSETPLFDTLTVSGTGQLYLQGSGFVFHDGEWSLDFYNGFDKIIDPVSTQNGQTGMNAESGTLNDTAAWAIGALNDLFNPLKALAITDVYFNRHTLFSAPSFSVAGFGLKFDNYLLRSNEVCFGGRIDFKIVNGEIQNVFFNSEGLKSIEADLKFDLASNLGLLQKGAEAGGNLIVHYYDPDYLASLKERGYNPPGEKVGIDFKAKLKSIGGVGVQISFKHVADGRIFPNVIGFQADPPMPGILVTGGTYLTSIRGAIKELADTIAGGSSTIPLTVEAGAGITFGQSPAVFNGQVDMVLKMTGIELNGTLAYKNKPMITQAQIKAQWVTPWFVSASMEMDVLGLNVIVGKARLFIGQNLEKDRIDFEGFVNAALMIPESVPVVGGFQIGQVSFGLNNDKIWGSASVGIKPIMVSVGITYYWSGGIEFGTDGEGLPEAYTYLLLERPEEEPVLVAIGSGMRTEATSWVNEDTIHEIEYHAIGDGVSFLDNGQNDIGLGGIEVSNGGRTHVIPVNTVADDRDALIEIEYYGEEKSANELEEMLTLTDGAGKAYNIQIGDMNAPINGDTAFRQELVTEDGVNRHLVYVMVPHTYINGSFTLTSAERVQTKLLSTPVVSTLDSVTLTENGTDGIATVKVDNVHEGDTVSLYLTRETVGTAVEYITTNSGEKIPVTEDKDPGVMIFDGIPVGANGVAETSFDLTNISGDYAVEGLGDIRELLESGDYYIRAALKSDTGYDAMTSANSIHITDPKAPSAASDATLTSAGNGYFTLDFATATANGENSVDAYRVDFCDGDGNLYPNYNGMLFETADAEKYLDEGNFRLGGWTVTGGEGTEEDPWTYSGLQTGESYKVKVYAAHRTEDGNYHYAEPAESAVTLLPEPQYVTFTSITSTDGTVSLKPNASGAITQNAPKQLVTAKTQPELTLTTNVSAKVDAYNGDEVVGYMEDGKLKLTGLKTDGDYAIELHAENNATKDQSVTVVYVTIDTTKPGLQITSPGSGAIVDFRNITLTGATEPDSTVTANGRAIRVAKDGSFNTVVTLNNALASGEIELIVTDKAGNINRAVIPAINGGFAAPVGINVVRIGTMRKGTQQTAQVFLKFADGKTESGVQKYRSVPVSAADRDKLSFDVVRGDAVSVDDKGKITASKEGAALMLVNYKVNDTVSINTTLAVSVDDSRTTTPVNGGGSAGIEIAKPTTADAVVNGKSETVTVDNSGTTTMQIGKDDGIDTKRTLDVENPTDASRYVLRVDADVAKELSGESGEGVRFTGGGSQVQVPGSVMTGDAFTVIISNPSATEKKKCEDTAKQQNVQIVDSGATVTVTGATIRPGDKVAVRLELPVGVNAKEITALVFVNENGEYTNLPWKLDVAGSTAYVRCYLPESGTIVPVKSGITFSDVSTDFWGAAAIRDAAGQMLIRGYGNGTFKPLGEVTRVEFATVMLRASGLMTARRAETHYSDVKTSDWFHETVGIATELGIMNGYEDSTARPNNRISRVEGMVISSRLLKLEKLSGEISDTEAEELLSSFKDKDLLPAWAKKDIALCVKYGIINGIDGAIRPNDPLSRAQAAAIAARLSAAIAKAL